MPKPELEFFPVSNTPWHPVQGSKCKGLDERVLAANGPVATRILRFAPGTDTTPNGEQAHEFFAEVYILSGFLTDLRLGQTLSTGMYACRPPGCCTAPGPPRRGARSSKSAT